MKVLIIEADSAVADATALLLRIEGHEIVCASGMEEAGDVVAASGSVPNAIVCDAHLLHGGNALDAIERLRARIGRTIPTLVTGDAPSLLRQGISSIQACRIVPKPAFSGELTAVLRQLSED